jgi:hypothetical protein
MQRESIEVTVARIEEKLDTVLSAQSTYVNMDQFRPVRAIVYGMVGIILCSVVGALVYTVVRNSPVQSVAAVRDAMKFPVAGIIE